MIRHHCCWQFSFQLEKGGGFYKVQNVFFLQFIGGRLDVFCALFMVISSSYLSAFLSICLSGYYSIPQKMALIVQMGPKEVPIGQKHLG